MTKRISVVCQHLENVSRSALEKYQDIIRAYIRHRHGIYALYHRDRLYYVGLARNLRTRLKQHLRDRHGSSWDRFSVYLTISDGHIKELESLLLRIGKPKGNKQGGKFSKSENLRTRLARDIRHSQRNELNMLMGRLKLKLVEVPEDGDAKVAVLAEYTTRPFRLRARFKGHTVRARVRRDGSIRFGKRIFNSPSQAAARACGRRTCNGWSFWRYERAPGDWVPLSVLRR